jgi:hypothetical protein
MEKDCNFNGAGGHDPSSSRRPSRRLTDEELFARLPELHQTVQHLPAARPDAVARARKLVADPDYPSSAKLRALSRQLAVHLLADHDSFQS